MRSLDQAERSMQRMMDLGLVLALVLGVAVTLIGAVFATGGR